jgi:hypothetical protein
MLKYKPTPVERLKVGDLLDLSCDPLVKHARNAETATPAMLDRLDYDFIEVLDIERRSLTATILTQWGDLVFPIEHRVPVFDEA